MIRNTAAAAGVGFLRESQAPHAAPALSLLQLLKGPGWTTRKVPMTASPMSTTKYAASSLESGHTCCRNFRRKMDESSEVGSVIAHREDDGPPP